jgi:ribonucleotide reductase alpha subunit
MNREQECFDTSECVANMEKKYGKDQEYINELTGKFYTIIYDDYIVPNQSITNSLCTGQSILIESDGAVVINIDKFENSGYFDWLSLEQIVRLTIRFIDDLYERDTNPEKHAHLLIKGWKKLLANMNIKSNSDKDLDFLDYALWYTSFFACLESNVLAEEKGRGEWKIDEVALDSILNHKQYSSGGFNIPEFKMRDLSIEIEMENEV